MKKSEIIIKTIQEPCQQTYLFFKTLFLIKTAFVYNGLV